MYNYFQRRLYTTNRILFTTFILFVGCLLFALCFTFLIIRIGDQNTKTRQPNKSNRFPLRVKEHVQLPETVTFDHFSQWNRSLCSIKSDGRGRHQKIYSISIFGTKSKYTDSGMFSWDSSILLLLLPLIAEIERQLPTWILRVYVDFTGSTKAQQDILYNFSNIDVCDISNIPMFGSSLPTYLPGKMWRFLPVFDPFADYVLSRDLDSPLLPRETETIHMWLTDAQEKKFFHILRDHHQHGIPILGGLWGAATVRARQKLFDIFKPMLSPSKVRRYTGTGDQDFLRQIVWRHVSHRSLIFDSYFCETMGGQPFLSQRPVGQCHVGCVRTCCKNMTNVNFVETTKPCPIACRPKDHLDWTYC